MLKRATAVGALLLTSLAAPAAASAATQIPPDGGVSGRLVDGTIVSLRFSPSAFRQVAGRRVVIACTQLGPDRPGITWEAVGSEAFRMPKRRRVVRRFVGKGYDYCTLRLGRKRLVTFATSDRGAVLVDEQYRTISRARLAFGHPAARIGGLLQRRRRARCRRGAVGRGPAPLHRVQRRRCAPHERRQVPERRNLLVRLDEDARLD